MQGERRSAWGLAIVATLGMSVSYVDRQTVSAIAPSVRQALGIDHTQFGFLISAFSIAYLLFAPIAGIIVDRLGARTSFALAVVAWSLVAAGHALATSFAILFVLRILLGTAEAPAFPSAAQAIHRALPDARRPLAFGLLFTGSSFGAIAAVKIAVPLDTHYGFRFAFFGSTLIGLLWLPAWLWVSRGLPSGHEAARAKRVDVAPTPWGAMAVSPIVLRALIAIVGSATLMMFALNFGSQYLVEHWHVAKGAVANYLIPPPILFDAGAIGFGALASFRERSFKKQKTHRFLLLIGAALGACLALAPLARTPWEAVFFFALACCGGGALYALVTADMLARVPSDRTSAAGGLMAAAQSLTHIVASPLVGYSIDRTHDYTVALVTLGVLVIPTTIIFVAWPVDSE